MLLYELLLGLRYEIFGVDLKWEISRPLSDSRNSVLGGLFVCIDGTRESGASYAVSALANGCRAVVATEKIAGCPTVVVGDTRFALAVIWNNFYKRPAEGMRLFGITGTNGKTSTAQFLFSCLRADGRQAGIIGTLGSFAMDERIDIPGSEIKDAAAAMTTPDPEGLFGTLKEFQNRGITDVVMEVSSHAIRQRKVDALSFEVGIFTNLSQDHLDFHENMEDYFKTKASFVARCEKRVVNCDDPWGRRFASAVPSVEMCASVLSEVEVGNGGVSYCYKDMRITSSVGGGFTVYNTLSAYLGATLSGVGKERAREGIAAVSSVKGRLERVIRAEEQGFDLIIDYAHTPAALEGVLLHLKKSSKGRLICVFGCGGDRDKSKRPVMGRVAEIYSDAVVVTNDNPRCEEPLGIMRDIISGMVLSRAVVIPDRREAIFAAVSMADKGDTVLLAGKGHETYEIRDGKILSFDEREVVTEAVKLKYGK